MHNHVGRGLATRHAIRLGPANKLSHCYLLAVDNKRQKKKEEKEKK
jgi:hypothetical protein